jgi:hypothetical protein
MCNYDSQVTKVDDMRFETFVAVTIQVKVFWFVMPCSVVVGYH